MTAPADRPPVAAGGSPRGVRARWRQEAGMSLIEVLIAMLVLVVEMLAVFDGISSAKRGTTAAERSAVLAQAGEQALQAIEALPYADIADSATPTKTSTTNTQDPTYYLSTCTAGTCYQWDPSSQSATEPVAVDTVNGLVNPGPTTGVVAAPNITGCTTASTSACRITYSIYRFVTNVTDSVCSQSGVTCPSTTSYKRITVAVRNTGPGPPFNPVYLSTFVSTKIGSTANPLTASTTTCLDGTTTVACER
jgi:Tfp pilus assembly protein PilV